jgi:hypothetical protein
MSNSKCPRKPKTCKNGVRLSNGKFPTRKTQNSASASFSVILKANTDEQIHLKAMITKLCRALEIQANAKCKKIKYNGYKISFHVVKSKRQSSIRH